MVLVVDGTQSCQLLLSPQKKAILDRIDFFVMSTHKWIGNVKTCGLIRYRSLASLPCAPAISFGWEHLTPETATVEKVALGL